MQQPSIFPIPEIDKIICNYLDLMFYYQTFSLINKYYRMRIMNNRKYCSFKKFIAWNFERRKSEYGWLVRDNSNFYSTKIDVFKYICEFSFFKGAKYLFYKYSLAEDIISGINNVFVNACRGGNLKIIKWLYSLSKLYHFRIDIHWNNEVAFRECCRNGHLNMIKYLIELADSENNPVDVDATVSYHYIRTTDSGFSNACVSGHLNVIEWFLTFCHERNISLDIHHMDDFAFYNGCKNGHIEIIKLLLKVGTERNEPFDLLGNPNKYYGSFTIACKHGHFEVAKLLYDSSKNGDNHIYSAYLKDNLTNRNGSLNSKNDPFKWSCINGHLEISKWLYKLAIEAGHCFSSNFYNKVFRRSCQHNNLDMVKWLYHKATKLKIQINIRSGGIFGIEQLRPIPKYIAKSDCAFIIACKNNNLSIVNWLCEIYHGYSFIISNNKITNFTIKDDNDICYECTFNKTIIGLIPQTEPNGLIRRRVPKYMPGIYL